MANEQELEGAIQGFTKDNPQAYFIGLVQIPDEKMREISGKLRAVIDDVGK